MADYWCIECGLPAELPLDRDIVRDDCRCWACAGPVVSIPQLHYWNNLSFQALLDKRIRQLHAGESVQLAQFGPRVKFAISTAADYLLLEALERDS